MIEAWTLRTDRVCEEEEAFRQKLRNLSDEERANFYRIYNKKLRDPDTYAVLNWLFLTGMHHAYLGRWVRALINLSVMVIGIMLLFTENAPVGFLMIIAILAIEIPALFRSQVIVADFNTQQGEEVLRQMQSQASQPAQNQT